MAALTADRNTPSKATFRRVKLKVKGATKIYAGALVAVVGGYAVPAGDTVGHTVIGRAEDTVDNSAGADGAKEIEVSTGVFKYATATIAQANVGADATVVDDQTLGLAAGTTNDIVAGRIEEIDSDGVWIATRA